MRRILEFLGVNVFLAAIIGAMVATFFVTYGAVVWLDLPDLPHGILGVCAVALTVAAGVLTAKAGDRLINGRRRRLGQ